MSNNGLHALLAVACRKGAQELIGLSFCHASLVRPVYLVRADQTHPCRPSLSPECLEHRHAMTQGGVMPPHAIRMAGHSVPFRRALLPTTTLSLGHWILPS